MHELNLKEIQAEELKALERLDNLCRKLGIKYFLAYGTLLGAIRHNGFIPWDDDVDVMMLRADYEVFREYVNSHPDEMHPFKLCYRENTQNYTCSVPRFVNTDFEFVSHYSYEKKFSLGLFIDIYPLDNHTDNKESGLRLHKKIRAMDKRYIIYINPANGRHNIKTLVRYILCFFLHIAWGKQHNFETKIKKYLARKTKITDRYVASADMPYILERSLFENSTEHIFAGKNFMIPKDYDTVLCAEYGDYMQLPPEEKRIPQHNYSILSQ